MTTSTIGAGGGANPYTYVVATDPITGVTSTTTYNNGKLNSIATSYLGAPISATDYDLTTGNVVSEARYVDGTLLTQSSYDAKTGALLTHHLYAGPNVLLERHQHFLERHQGRDILS